MLGSISIAATGLKGFERGLRNISNNTANLDTPGFKGSSTQFADLFYGNGNSVAGGNSGSGQFGYGLNAVGTSLNFAQGDLQNTGNALDLAVNGQGFFVLRDATGALHYTRDGQFKFNTEGTLVSTATGEEVMAADAGGQLSTITLNGLRAGAPSATSTVTLGGNLSSTATTATVGSVTVIDSAGGTHSLTIGLTPVTGTPGSWTVTLTDGTNPVGTGTIQFNNGQPVSGQDKVALTYTPAGGTAIPLTLDFSTNVTSFDSGSASSLAVASQNGFAAGNLTQVTFDASGTMVLAYSNGQTVKNKQIALAQFSSVDDVQTVGNNEFAAKGGASWQIGLASTAQFGSVKSGTVEKSNVDLSGEFSDLVIMQRGYQACSQVISTASEMLNALFGMMSK